MQYIIMCRSLTYAQRAARVLERAGIYAGLAKAPQGMTPQGCSFGVKIAAKNLTKALALMAGAGIKRGKLFALEGDGQVWEVEP